MNKNHYNHNFFEEDAWKDGMLVCGIDEAGRGCLAGPVVVGAVILPINAKHKLLKDSKILSKSQRAEAYEWIVNHCYYSVALANHRIIDRHNIYQATLQTMKQALLNILTVFKKPHNLLRYVTIDAMPLHYASLSDNFSTQFHYFPHAESISSSVAAASIVAKVTRDNIMMRLDKNFPYLNFKAHKGYGTQEHRNNMQRHGQSMIHRITFCGNLFCEKNNHAQQKLF